MLDDQLLGNVLEVPLTHSPESIPDVLLDEFFRFRDCLFGIAGAICSHISVSGSSRRLWRSASQVWPGVGLEEGGQERQRGKRGITRQLSLRRAADSSQWEPASVNNKTHQLLEDLHDPLPSTPIWGIPDDSNKGQLRAYAKNRALLDNSRVVLLLSLFRGETGKGGARRCTQRRRQRSHSLRRKRCREPTMNRADYLQTNGPHPPRETGHRQ